MLTASERFGVFYVYYLLMSVQVIVGAQWGDEGKGKIIDLLSENADYVARYQGGANAGHTVVTNNKQYVLHLLPSGILHPHTICMLGNGVVIDPVALLKEIDFLNAQDININGRLLISSRAHLILPYHKRTDHHREEFAQQKKKIGTTGRGIGPAYVDKANRVGIRMGDLLNPKDLKEKIALNIAEKNAISLALYGKTPINTDEMFAEYLDLGKKLSPYISDVSLKLNKGISEGKRILCEGAQGTLLDLDHGTYPYVTSSSPTSGGATVGLGIAPTRINEVIGVIKAYATRVGMGPFPTELSEGNGIDLRALGSEYGATTGRPRRCGWFDVVVANYAVQINGIHTWAVTKLDVLDTLSEIKVCVAYKYREQEVTDFPSEMEIIQNCEPIYQSFPGWQQSTSHIRKFSQLPKLAQNYLRAIEDYTKTPIRVISVGAERDRTIIR